MIYFDSDMSKSTNTVVDFDWKMVIYIYVCGKCHTQFMLPNSSRRYFINMYIYIHVRIVCLYDWYLLKHFISIVDENANQPTNFNQYDKQPTSNNAK